METQPQPRSPEQRPRTPTEAANVTMRKWANRIENCALVLGIANAVPFAVQHFQSGDITWGTIATIGAGLGTLAIGLKTGEWAINTFSHKQQAR